MSSINKLSKESAEKYYKKLLQYHNDDRELTKKVHDFYHDLEHYILKEITGENVYYDQFGVLLKNQRKWEQGRTTGEISPTIVSGINFLSKWRVEAVHYNEMDCTIYKALLRIMVLTIFEFSDVPITDELEEIFNNQPQQIILNDIEKSDKKLSIDPIIFERVNRKIEDNLDIAKQTTPIVFFGNYNSAKACTISLKPSSKEFYNNEKMLTNGEERLCSRLELGKKDDEILSEEDVKKILKNCNNYFENNPFLDYFENIEYMINKFKYSYFKSKCNNLNMSYCVHLNLVQWATEKNWEDLGPLKAKHIENDKYVLQTLVDNNKNIEIIFLNGKTVVSEFENYFGVKFDETLINDFKERKDKDKENHKIKIFTGKYNKIEIIGWNCFFGKPPIISDDDIDRLYDEINKLL